MRKQQVNDNITLEEICREEGSPSSGTLSITGLALTAIGQNLGTLFFDQNQISIINSGFFPVISKLSIISNRDIALQMRIDNYGPYTFKGANDNLTPNGFNRINTTIRLKVNIRYELNKPELLYFGFLSPIDFVNQGYDNTDATLLDIRVEWSGFSITKNTDLTADNVMIGIGDSIMNGTGAGSFESNTQEPFFQQVKKSIIEKGYRVRGVNKSQGTMTSSSIVQAIKWGYYNVRQADFILLMIGANDANNLGSGGLSITANQTIFSTNINYIIRFFNKRYPTAKILICGSTPSADNTTEGRIAIARGLAQTAVTSYNNANVKYVDLGSSFDRTNTANYLASDTIHTTAQNLVSGAINAIMTTYNWFQ